MTEASGLVSIDPLHGDGAKGSVGWALPYTQVDVLRQDADGYLGQPCDIGKIGVIAISGDHVSPRHSDPKHNNDVFTTGVLNSGDLGNKNAQGRFYIAGRSKDLIIRSDHNIDPAMIKNAMTAHPAVAVTAAIGMPDAYAGELPICFGQLHVGAEVSDADLQAHAQNMINERPASPKRIQVTDTITRTSVGKIYKPGLRCEATKLRVTDLVRNEMGLHNAHTYVVDGGARGMCVTVTVTEGDELSVPALEQTLAAYLFEAKVLATRANVSLLTLGEIVPYKRNRLRSR